MTEPKQRVVLDWYSVSVDAVRVLLLVVVGLLVVVLGYFGYERYNEYRLQQKASMWIAKSEPLLRQLRAEHAGVAYAADLDTAAQRLDEARAAYGRGAYRSSIAHGRSCFALLEDVLERARLGGSIAWFLGVQGDVQYRRGEDGPFLKAYARTELREGDYVRSDKGSSAEIHFRDEETVFRLRPNSLIKLTRDLGTAGGETTLGYMEYGWVSLDTADSPTSVETPYSRVRAAERSLVSVSLEEGSAGSRVRVSQGRAEVRDKRGGETRTLSERQEVRQTDSGFSPTIELPPHPLLIEPPDGVSINIDTTDRVTLAWSAVPGAARYVLQVSKSRLFGDNVIDVSNRRSTTATLGLREEGSYVWRVAAIDGRGSVGPWSETRTLRVASYRELALEEDRVPPPLEVELVMNGNIAVVVGSTEPGASVTIDGEEVLVAANGRFTTTHRVYDTGLVEIVFVAIDSAGNRTVERRRVYVDEG